MLATSWASFNSIITVPVRRLALNPWRASCIYRLARKRVSISASAIFHRFSNRIMPCVSMISF